MRQICLVTVEAVGFGSVAVATECYSGSQTCEVTGLASGFGNQIYLRREQWVSDLHSSLGGEE